ncbi:MAG: C40 family peptidase [Methylobacter sp.]|uniref:C40 family peptidase n=1 Tax=Candidatus Methylobacter titanis TaxID=3053457 RepID=A0AA43TKJ3_9GAMM|nr:C40 family peptidase [Candidatus Methylobacter titanis]
MNAYIAKNKHYFFIRWVLLSAIVLFAGCAGVPEIKPIANYSPMVSYALSLQGVPYRYGKSSPEEGFDCSGFVQHVYGRQGIALPRTTQKIAQSAALTQVPKNDLHPGDLLFFNTNGKPFSHVGIYVSNHNFIHAPSQRTGRVLVSSLKNRYWENRFSCARRP